MTDHVQTQTQDKTLDEQQGHVIYVAGAFRAKNAWSVEANIRRAEELALRAWDNGYYPICPQAMTRYYDGVLEDDVFLRGLTYIMLRCDAVLVVSEGWARSKGTMHEIAVAKAHGIPVFHTLADLNDARDNGQLPNLRGPNRQR